MLKFIPLLCASVILVGCEQYYRYPCQDPNNWELDTCKKPLCEVNRDCPEHIFKEDKVISTPTPSPSRPKGAC